MTAQVSAKVRREPFDKLRAGSGGTPASHPGDVGVAGVLRLRSGQALRLRHAFTS